MSDEPIRETLARAMRAQGTDPDRVFAEADQLDLTETEEASAAAEAAEAEVLALPVDESRGYGWEPQGDPEAA